MPMDTDTALQLLGRYSKWQMRNYLMYAIGFSIPFAWMAMSIIFIGDTPNYRCAVPPNSTVNESIPWECNAKTGKCKHSQCEIYLYPGTDDNSTGPCTHGYWYDPESGYESTLVTEWDLVCGSNWLVELSMTIGNVGSWIGALFFTRLSDLYGRKKVFLFCLWTNIVVATIQAFSPNYYFYTAFSFLDGIQQQGCMASSAVLAIELFPTNQRNFAMNAVEFFWAFGYISLVPFVYYIRNWRHLQLAITLPLTLTISYYWFIEESIPWQVANGRFKDADDAMHRAAKLNKISIPDHIFTTDTQPLTEKGEKEKQAPVHQYGVLDIFRNKTARNWTIISFFIWFANNLTYYAISFTVTYLPGNRYLNYFLYGLMEIPAYGLTWLLLEKVGRRIPLCIFHIIAGIALLATFIQTMEWGKELEWLVIAFSVIGKFFITCSYATIFVHTPEFYPTNVRNVGLGMCMFTSRIASFIGPYARILARYQPWIPTVIMGTLSVIAGGLALLLPETRWVPLPETIEEMANWKGQDLSKKAVYKRAPTSDTEFKAI